MKHLPIVLGIILIVLGVYSLAIGRFNYSTQEEVVKIGDVKVTSQENKQVTLPPLLGGICLAGGIALIIFARRK